jgi:hypothetical protein
MATNNAAMTAKSTNGTAKSHSANRFVRKSHGRPAPRNQLNGSAARDQKTAHVSRLSVDPGASNSITDITAGSMETSPRIAQITVRIMPAVLFTSKSYHGRSVARFELDVRTIELAHVATTQQLERANRSGA